MTKENGLSEAKDLAVFCARIAENKLARDVVILDLTRVDNSPTDYFVICSCETDNHVRSLSRDLQRRCKENDVRAPKAEGTDVCNWVLMDFFDVVVHVMLDKVRDYYKLEKLWADGDFFALDNYGEPRKYKEENLRKLLIESPTA